MSFNFKIVNEDDEKTVGTKANLEKLAGEIADMNYSKFTEGDDYASLTKRYSQQGQKAMDDTIGKVAARTGGLASSYATAAGNQAYNEHMGKLEDAARALYDSQRQEKIDNLGISQSIYQQNYQEDRDKVEDNRWERQWASSEEQRGIDNKYRQNAFDQETKDKTLTNQKGALEKEFYYNPDAYASYEDYMTKFPDSLVDEATFNQIKSTAMGMYEEDNKPNTVAPGKLSDTDRAILDEYNNIVKNGRTPSPELKRRHDEILGLYSDIIADLGEKALKATTLEEVSWYIMEIDKYDPEEAERIFAEWEKAHTQIDPAYWSGKATNAGYKYDEKIFN